MWLKYLYCLMIFAPPLFAVAQGGDGPRSLERHPLRTEVETIISEVRPKPDLRQLKKFIDGAPQFREATSLEEISTGLSSYVFQTWKIQPDNSYQSRKQRDNVLPDSVLSTRKGHCLGVSTLYLLAAERTGIDAALVRAPDHVFVRICKEGRCLNIETLKNGAVTSDTYYIENLAIPKPAIENQNYLASLRSASELGASLYLGLGFVSAASRQLELAALFYEKSTQKSPKFAEAYSNLAAVKSQLGAGSEEVLSLLKRAAQENPTHYATALNLAAYYQSKKDFTLALEHYGRAIESNPVSLLAYQRRAALLAETNREKDALLDLDKALVIQPKNCSVRELRVAIRKKLGQTSLRDPELEKLRSSGACK
ncbi:MAG: hypothetical protein KGQ59_00660 [Bdellovibrionales bacterium]|nr:hypothetical protein [Bdellovibrionales bacterium]